MKDTTYKTNKIANLNDYQDITILFSDKVITKLFTQLLKTKGVHPKPINSLKELNESEKIITEPLYYKQLSPNLQEHCLLLTSKKETGIAGICLTQPLTERKIETALSSFLAVH